MKVFISWSGLLSKEVASLLARWLPRVLGCLDPFLSVRIQKGKGWFEHIRSQLGESDFCIVCITPENRLAPWIHFEAGAALRTTGKSGVYPLLIGLSPSELKGSPFDLLQACTTTKDDMLQLVHTITESLSCKNRIRYRLEKACARFEKEVQAAVRRAEKRGEPPLQMVWGLTDRDKKRISLFASCAAVIQEGGYSKTAVSYGQTLAITHIVNSLGQAYPGVHISPPYLSGPEDQDACMHTVQESSAIICLGGPKHNAVSRWLFKKGARPTYWFRKCSKCDLRGVECKEYRLVKLNQRRGYTPRIADGEGVDYGTIIKTMVGRRRVFIFAGCHSFGTAAAAQVFCQELPQSRYIEGFKGSTKFQIVVRAQVSHSLVTGVEVVKVCRLR